MKPGSGLCRIWGDRTIPAREIDTNASNEVPDSVESPAITLELYVQSGTSELGGLDHEKHKFSGLQLFHIYARFPPQNHLTQYHTGSKAQGNTPGTVSTPHP